MSLQAVLTPSGEDIGAIRFQLGTTIPPGWLEFSTTPISRTTYAALFAKIGTTYGSGDGSTTFNIPWQNITVLNSGGTLPIGGSGGQANVTLVVSELPAHQHTSGNMSANATHTHTVSTGASGDHIHAADMVAQAGTGYTGPVYQDDGSNGWQYINSSSAGAHSHTYTLPSADLSHTHSISSAGADGSHNNMQPYIALVGIIRALP